MNTKCFIAIKINTDYGKFLYLKLCICFKFILHFIEYNLINEKYKKYESTKRYEKVRKVRKGVKNDRIDKNT